MNLAIDPAVMNLVKSVSVAVTSVSVCAVKSALLYAASATGMN